MRPRLLDLYAGAGGSAVGYARAGFEVIGVEARRCRATRSCSCSRTRSRS
jgi:tRNA/tmRNA/rRNA uracil-C5-methylase (TrmA/RlmC/RlmD family)